MAAVAQHRDLLGASATETFMALFLWTAMAHGAHYNLAGTIALPASLIWRHEARKLLRLSTTLASHCRPHGSTSRMLSWMALDHTLVHTSVVFMATRVPARERNHAVRSRVGFPPAPARKPLGKLLVFYMASRTSPATLSGGRRAARGPVPDTFQVIYTVAVQTRPDLTVSVDFTGTHKTDVYALLDLLYDGGCERLVDLLQVRVQLRLQVRL